jgi:2-polyprenyl-3-methyl-5-hydroxy-6-metoxy-1,4-benzoquinol methylase/tRNA A-37 threonylcarbamoyl transferase component Bud32
MISFNQICQEFPNVDDIVFISESEADTSRKTFLLDDVIIKSRKLDDDESAHLRHNDLKEEYEILKLSDAVKGIPKALHYCKNEVFELLFLNCLPGVQLRNMQLSFFETIKVSLKVLVILVRLSGKKISHNDVTPQNVLLTDKNSVSLVDFDQAVRTTIVKAFAGNIFGIKSGESKVSYGLITIFKDYLRKHFPNFLYSLKRMVGRNPEFEKHELPAINDDADPKLKKLLDAWRIAQKSNASAPALPLAYYAIDFKGDHFPGERPWNERWERLKSLSDYSGKTILELGCNMGLLSIHLLKEAGAAKCIGIDHDKKILESAKLISEVYDVNPQFKKINFDSAKNWESDLLSENIDIVFALNVLNWVNDKDRLLSFLSNFPEIIFEGHDATEVERKRFEQIGFKTIEEIGYSERERIILRCRK